MTVGELIEHLAKFDPNLPAVVNMTVTDYTPDEQIEIANCTQKEGVYWCSGYEPPPRVGKMVLIS